MASASVSAATGLETTGCLGSVGRFWANSPITAHPERRMHGIPLRVVLFSFRGSQVQTLKPWQAEVAQFTCDRKAADVAGKTRAGIALVMHQHASARKARLFSR